MDNRFESLTQPMIVAVEAEMRAVMGADGSSPDPFAGMIHYHMGWADADLAPIDRPGGKRIRPLLVLLSCQAAGGQWEQAVPAAAAVEILHNFTLVHDDIQDQSPLRRGLATVWRLWGVPQAINTGDAMFALAQLAMLRLADRDVPAPTVVQAMRRLNETCLALTQGQYADMRFEARSDVAMSEYLSMIEGKTAALLSLSAELGALVAGRAPDTVRLYADFARHLGLAFQVRDDILGIWGQEEAIGKSAATDITTRKKSLPVLYGLERLPELRALYASAAAGNGFVEQAIALLDRVDALGFAEREERAHTEAARACLLAAGAGPKSLLTHIVDQLLGRTT